MVHIAVYVWTFSIKFFCRVFVGNELGVSPTTLRNCFFFRLRFRLVPMYTLTRVVGLKHYKSKALLTRIISVPCLDHSVRARMSNVFSDVLKIFDVHQLHLVT